MKNLSKWKRPSNYAGETFESYFRGLGRHRDSDALTRSNFRVALEMLGGESLCECDGECSGEHAVIVTRAGHWAVGWVEEILVHASATAKLEILSKIQSDLADYPVLDESDFCDEEMQEADETFESCITDFRREFFEFFGFKNRGISPRDSRATEIDAIISRIFQDDIGYRGIQDAYVTQKSIERYLEGKGRYDIPSLAKDGNRVAALLLKLNQVQSSKNSA